MVIRWSYIHRSQTSSRLRVTHILDCNSCEGGHSTTSWWVVASSIFTIRSTSHLGNGSCLEVACRTLERKINQRHGMQTNKSVKKIVMKEIRKTSTTPSYLWTYKEHIVFPIRLCFMALTFNIIAILKSFSFLLYYFFYNLLKSICKKNCF